MKNIHVLKTDKPSSLYKVNDKLYFEEFPVRTVNAGNQHIYITNSEETKEGDWVITSTNDIIQWAKVFQPIGEKIILTTDQDLIKDGVQDIGDEFLEWFVKNPTCEKVDVDLWTISRRNSESFNPPLREYKINIPIEELKQETLEEASKIFAENTRLKNPANIFWEGAKWQEERSYSEDDIKNAIDYGAELGLSDDIGNSFEWKRKKDLWFEQFKINNKK